MRVAITIDPRDRHRDRVRDDAEFWLRHHAQDRWRVREDEDFDGRELLTFEFMDSQDAMTSATGLHPSSTGGASSDARVGAFVPAVGSRARGGVVDLHETRGAGPPALPSRRRTCARREARAAGGKAARAVAPEVLVGLLRELREQRITP